MNDLMLIDNVLYSLHKTDSPYFVLKSDVQEILEKGGPVMLMPKQQKCLVFKGKYYAFNRVKQKENEQTILQTSDGNSGQ